VAGINPADAGQGFEPSHRVATVGIVRACQDNDNGTSNLLLQGLARIEVLEIIREEPYRTIRVRPLLSQSGAPEAENLRLKTSLARLLALKRRLTGDSPGDFDRFLKTVEDPDAYVDLAAFNLCEDAELKQRLLETLSVHERLRLFTRHLRHAIDQIRLRQLLQGPLADDSIGSN
jgi:ATP-dependent Lon protease